MSGAVTAIGVTAVAAGAIGETILGSVILADAAAGAIGAAAGAAVTGQNIGEAILKGGLGGAVGGYVGSEAEAAGASPELARAASSFASGTTKGLVSGQGVGESLRGGLVGAGLSYAGDELFGAPPGRDASLGDKLIAGGERALLNKAVSSLFEPSRSGVGATSYSPTARSSGQSASTQALSQALRTGDPGAPLFGTEGKEGQRKNVWNTASLKLKDETGT
jgi:hypothetical protein